MVIACSEEKKSFIVQTEGGSKLCVDLPCTLWNEAQKLRTSFKPDGELNDLELALSFMNHARLQGKDMLAANIFSLIRSNHLGGNDPHAVLPDLIGSKIASSEAFRILYEAETNLRQAISHLESRSAIPAFMRDALVKPALLFGGQACSDDLLHELKTLLDAYRPLVGSLFEALADVLKNLSLDPEASDCFVQGFDLKGWLDGQLPSQEYQLAAPCSLPLIGLIQLLNYQVMIKAGNLSYAEFASKVVGSTGHSQGIVPAAVVSIATNETEFVAGAIDAVKVLFWIGVRAQKMFVDPAVSAAITQDCIDNGEGPITSMLSVSGLPLDALEAKIAAATSDGKISIGLKNGPSTFVCCGPKKELYGLVLALRKIGASDSEDQSRVPFNERKHRFSMRFLPISTVFHSPLQYDSVEAILSDCKRTGCSFFNSPTQFLFPVRHTATGETLSSTGLLKSLIEQICTLPVDWIKSVAFKGATHLIDFGPGYQAGIGALTARNIEGSGVQVVLATLQEATGSLLGMKELFNTKESLPMAVSWKAKYAPRLTKANGKVWVDTRFSRLLGKPPIMVAGMTPCTVAEPFVTACTKAGYHVELAGGGHFNEEVLRAKIDLIIDKVGPGCSITLNSLFLNPRLWAFQYPAVKKMRLEGYPIDGFTIAAGVPSFDSACEIVESLRQAGIRHVDFKPGSTQSILDVVKIAKANPRMPVVLQWTGGRGGGHHSFEDFHGPIVETYAEIRSAENIVLVAGSGFGDGEGSLPYLTGDWSVSLGLPPMPFDGILLGSRVMVAAENLASAPVKDLIVGADGVSDEKEWIGSYKRPVGGVVTVRSELGEPIHKIATRGVLLWKELDETIFCLPAGEKRMAAIKKKRDYIIARLNADHQKVWFGKKADGKVCDLAEMTYEEIAVRLGELCYVWHQKRWIDVTYKKLLELFLHRTEERFVSSDRSASKLPNHSEWIKEDGSEMNPTEVIEPFLAHYPLAKQTIINTEDIRAFLSMSSIPWHKPVPFIPTLDDDKLEFWFKKDSLWQAEDVDAVYGQDAGRVAILHGPVAAKYSRQANEPVKKILDDINQYYLDHLPLAEGDEEEWFGGDKIEYPTTGIISRDSNSLTIRPEEKMTTCAWLELLSGQKKSWLRALLRCKFVVQGPKQVHPNRLRSLFKPRPGHYAKISTGGEHESIAIYNSANQVVVEASKRDTICVTMYYYTETEGGIESFPLNFHFEYHPEEPLYLIWEQTEHRSERIKEFYWRLWFGSNRGTELVQTKSLNLLNDTIEASSTVDGKKVERFKRLVNNLFGQAIPMDYCMVACWEVVMKALFSDAIQGDLLKLVHLSNKIERFSPKTELRPGESVQGQAHVLSIVQGPTGKTIEIQAQIKDESSILLQVTTAFFIRDDMSNNTILFERKPEQPRKLKKMSELETEIFLSKSFVKCEKVVSGLEIRDIDRVSHAGSKSLRATLFDGQSNVGSIEFGGSQDTAWEYLQRISEPIEQPVLFEHDGYEIHSAKITSPATNQLYSTCSGDHNPIHTSSLFADFAGLPGTITHGLWTAAAVSSTLADFCLRSYNVNFVDTVLPSTELNVKVRHVGMVNGRMLLKIATEDPAGRLVLSAEAEAYQPNVAYVFTGQGSQEVGMGMDLYGSSPIAKDIWDRAEAHFMGTYGFSILEIVRKNPKSKTVHFGGPKGAAIKANYMRLVYKTEVNGVKDTKRLFPEITEASHSYTFTSPAGLLSMTQFTQPALTLMEMAAFRTMRSRGLVSEECVFAGHSLGEYAALSSVADVLSVEAISDIVFFRGMSMQVAVQRDAEGRSPYGMAAVNPSRVKAGFTEDALRLVVRLVSETTGKLLEIVNYNVKNWQYVVAGEQFAIETLTRTLNFIHTNKDIDIKTLLSVDLARIEAGLRDIINGAAEQIKAEGHAFVVPQRGIATIPLSGIDVPFHSSFLLNGVIPFRAFLQEHIDTATFRPEVLKNRYIPNLVAKPFSLEREYIELVHRTCGSPILSDILKSGESVDQKELGVTLLIELLAYQFASPVRWIETQELMFGQLGVNRFIEVGPAPTLTGMAERTLNMSSGLVDSASCSQIRIYSHSKDRDELYFNFEDAPASEVVAPVTTEATAAQQTQTVQTQVTVQVQQNSRPIDELPMKGAELVHILVAQKTRRPGSEIALNKSVKELAGGKSTLQNELIGDFQKEFGAAGLPDRAEELPLAELGASLDKSAGFTRAPGKLVTAQMAKLFSAKMPSGFSPSAAKAWLQSTFAIGSKAADSIFAISLLDEPASRFGSEEAAKTWLRTVTTGYLKSHGIELSQAGSASPAAGAVISSEALEQIQAKQHAMLRKQLEVYAHYLGDRNKWDAADKTLATTLAEVKRLQAELDLLTTEHGVLYAEGLKPIFSSSKARTFDSWWNWARQEAAAILAEGRSVDPDYFSNRADEDLITLIEYHMKQNPEYIALCEATKKHLGEASKYRPKGQLTKPSLKISPSGKIEYSEAPRSGGYPEYVRESFETRKAGLSWLHLRSPAEDKPAEWVLDKQLTGLYAENMTRVAKEGQNFDDYYVLITGAGRGSIGSEMLKGLLEGGAHVVCTTSSYNKQTMDSFRHLYERHGSKGSRLVVVPFNQASMQDVNALVRFIYDELNWELDAIVPFAAIPENGRSLLDGLEDGRSELAHRLMLTNVLRLLGAVAKTKETRQVHTRPAQVLLPLSPNHGAFGYDGFYGESKAALETLLNRWHSESWQDYLSIVGAVIGWTRGTGLMNDNNLVAEEMEELGVRTFSTAEMAFNLLSLMTPDLVGISETRPVYADLAGGMNLIRDLNLATKRIREDIQAKATRIAALQDGSLVVKKSADLVQRRANFDFGFNLGKSNPSKNEALAELLDLSRTVVVTGFGEVGPWGSSRTRWEMEATGRFSLESCIQLAWMMGLIRYEAAPKNQALGKSFGGSWVDAQTGEPVADLDIKSRYEEHILKHTGIRVIEPVNFEGYDPTRKMLTQEVVLQEELGPLEVSPAEADAYLSQHGDKVHIVRSEERCLIRFLPGCVLYMPRALQMDRFVAGQLPTGWDATRYGVPKDIAEQVDPVTLYVLVSTVEALVRSGITDPYEFYQYVHLAEVGNTAGGGVGGQLSNQRMYRQRFQDKPVQSDILQESFINVMPAWVNLLLLSSAGPIKTPVGACATAVESVEIGVDTLLTGKAKIVLVGGYDDFREEGSAEFANMGATSSAAEEIKKGREPAEMSRPMASSRAGFMESMGAGMQVLMTADLAIKMGVPIYGIIGATSTATDKEGRSIPAPGQGILTSARSVRTGQRPRVLSLEHRLAQFRRAKASIQDWYRAELEANPTQQKDLELEAERMLAAERRLWGSVDFARGDDRIAPLEAGLAVFGLTVDDIGVASFHGTGTKANDVNESEVLQKQLAHLGRTPGNMLPAICQKYLTGHPKGAAAAWMLNGVMQCMSDGVIPANRNADNIEEKLRAFNFIYHPSAPIKPKNKIRAAVLKSFGFGQVGGEVLVVHPDYILAAIDPTTRQAYLERRTIREQRAIKYQHDALIGASAGLVQVKNAPPYPDHLESQVYLNPAARASFDGTSWSFSKESLLSAAGQEAENISSGANGVGVDVQLISDISMDSTFLERNFTPNEIAYCLAQPDPKASVAGRWAAKEAVIKALCSSKSSKPEWLAGPGAPLKPIEVTPSSSGAPTATLNGQPIDGVKLSISHSGSYAIAFAAIH